MLSRTMWVRCLPATATATSCALRVSTLPLFQLVGKCDCEIALESICHYADATSRPVSAGSRLSASTSRSMSTRTLLSAGFWKRQGGVHASGDRRLYSDSVGNLQSEINESSGVETSPEGSSRTTVRPLQPSLVADDFRSLIFSKKREVAILEAALEILETAPRNKQFEDLVRKHNIQLEPSKTEKRWEISEASSPKTVTRTSVFGDFVGNPKIDTQPSLALEAPSLVTDFSKATVVESNIVELEPAKTSDNQQGSQSNTTEPSSPKLDSSPMFSKLSLDDFPSPQDPNLERLQKKRRRLELMKEYERNNKIASLNFGAAAKSTGLGGSPTKVDSTVDSLKPSTTTFLEQPEKKPYRSLADRLYEEHFGRPAPANLKRTYPKGSFYDRCMKEKEQKEREAAAAAARATSSSASKSVPSLSSRPIRSGVSVVSQRDETNDNAIRRNATSNDINQEKKLASWRCPECNFSNSSTDKHCYKCQAKHGENGPDDGRDSGRRSMREKGEDLRERPKETWKV